MSFNTFLEIPSESDTQLYKMRPCLDKLVKACTAVNFATKLFR